MDLRQYLSGEDRSALGKHPRRSGHCYTIIDGVESLVTENTRTDDTGVRSLTRFKNELFDLMRHVDYDPLNPPARELELKKAIANENKQQRESKIKNAYSALDVLKKHGALKAHDVVRYVATNMSGGAWDQLHKAIDDAKAEDQAKRKAAAAKAKAEKAAQESEDSD